MHTVWIRRGAMVAWAVWCLSVATPIGASERVLSFGATQWPPFQYASPEGKSVGSDTEIIEAVVRRMGYVPDMKIQPWTRVEKLGQMGELAGIYSVVKTPERERLFHFTDSISTSRTVFFKRKSDDVVHWQTLAELSSYRVATAAGYAYPPVFQAAVRERQFKAVVETFGVGAERTNLMNLQRGVVDLVICEISVCQYLIKTHAAELSGIDYIPTVIGSVQSMHLAFSRKWPNAPQLTRAFNAELARWIASGGQKKVFDKYGIPNDLR